MDKLNLLNGWSGITNYFSYRSAQSFLNSASWIIKVITKCIIVC